jgi:uncharacterized protein (TIGR02444 family)
MPDAAAFWTWSLAIWPRVEALALKLQEEHGADANLLLFCAWVGRLAPEELDRAEAAVSLWRDSAVLPLRRARRAAKGSPLYAALKEVELAAEKFAQEQIVAAVPQPRGEADALALYLNRMRVSGALARAVSEAFQRS